MYRPIAFEVRKSGGLFKSCRFITIMHSRLKVPAKNSPALLFLSRGKEEERKTTTISCFSPAEEEQSRGILGGNFQMRVHDGNKAAGLKETTWMKLPVFINPNFLPEKSWLLKLKSSCLQYQMGLED